MGGGVSATEFTLLAQRAEMSSSRGRRDEENFFEPHNRVEASRRRPRLIPRNSVRAARHRISFDFDPAKVSRFRYASLDISRISVAPS